MRVSLGLLLTAQRATVAGRILCPVTDARAMLDEHSIQRDQQHKYIISYDARDLINLEGIEQNEGAASLVRSRRSSR
jgi:hypothetical protein